MPAQQVPWVRRGQWAVPVQQALPEQLVLLERRELPVQQVPPVLRDLPEPEARAQRGRRVRRDLRDRPDRKAYRV